MLTTKRELSIKMFKKEKDLSPCADCYNLCDYELYHREKDKDEYTMKTTLTVNLNNLTSEEREQLLKLLEKSNSKKGKVWKPNEGDTYFCISYYGQINDTVYIPTVGGEHYRIGNCFKTREEAEFAAEKQKLITEIKRYIAENDPEEVDLHNVIKAKYTILYNYRLRNFSTICSTGYAIGNCIYFSDKFDWRKMISDIGEDRIKKYLFGVK